MRPPGMLVIALALATAACPNPFPCNRYCWSHKQHVLDLTSEDVPGVPDGRFDVQCERFSDSADWYPPLPLYGWYGAEVCVPASDHQTIEEIVAAIQDPMIDASQTCDVTDLQVYTDLVQALAMQARDACVAHLTCNGAPAGCDIDPTTPEPDACQVPSAMDLCDQVILAPALAALGDLSNGPSAAQPQHDGTAIEYVDDPSDCEPLDQDTDGPPICGDGAGSGDGVDESTTAGGGTSGADTSGGSDRGG
jgi:hypothetical protein